MSITYRIGVDIGGTFTDIVFSGSDGSLHARKLLTMPDDYGRGIVKGITEGFEELGVEPDAVERVVHATTVATNAILEHVGAHTALITTEGFRDVLEMRRLRIPEMYTLNFRKPEPLVPRRLRLEVRERVGPRGEVWTPLDMDSVDAALDRLEAEKVDAVAVSLLHAYANPAHEQAIAERLRERLPETVYVTCGSDILPEIREYERTSTTVINAFLGPTLTRYFDSLRHHLDSIGVVAPLLVTKSDGGIMSVEMGRSKPSYLVESGPAAGVIGAAYVSKESARASCITLDMGGTTAKASMVENGEVARTADYEVGAGINLSSKLVMGGGYALKLPVIDISEIGAGGGSLVGIDAGGLLRVGPRSAGASPGPVAYNQGGETPTFTDAVVALGFLNPDYLVGGSLAIDSAKAIEALRKQVAAKLERDLLDTAYGVYQVACGTMVRAVKAVSTYRGRDPRDFDLFAFGGNGPVVAAEIARMLEMPSVTIPMHPGVFSSFGLLLSDVEQEVSLGYLRPLAQTSPDQVEKAFRDLETQLTEQMRAEGYEPGGYEVIRRADLRYTGQAHELAITVQPGADSVPDFARLAADFGAEHEKTYGHQAGEEAVETVTLRIVGRVTVKKPERGAGWQELADGRESAGGSREAFFGPDFGLLTVPIVSRLGLGEGARSGPLIVEEYDATCVVPPGWNASVDADANIRLVSEEGK